MNSEIKRVAGTRPARERLPNVRAGLLRLHKTLLDKERENYEKARGPVGSSGQFLQLVLQDPWFAWLRPLSALIVQIDEAMSAKEELTLEGADELLRQARALIAPAEGDAGFAGKYHEALQRSPDVLLAHAETLKQFSAERTTS